MQNNISNQILQLIKELNPEDPTQYVTDLVKNLSLSKINEKIKNCNLCGNNRCKTLLSGDFNSEILVINDMPKASQFINTNSTIIANTLENEYENVLFEILDELNIDPNKLLYCNCVSCMNINSSSLPCKNELCNCYNNILKDIIRIAVPKAILILGNTPLKVFYSENFLNIRGQLLDINGIEAMATYNLSYFETMKNLKEQNVLLTEYNTFKEDIINFFDYILKKGVKL